MGFKGSFAISLIIVIKGVKMRNIIICVLIVSIIFILPCHLNLSAVHPIKDFQIITKHAYAKNNKGEDKLIEFKKEITVIEYIKGEWYFNELVEVKDNEGYVYMKPLLDKNENTIRIKSNDKEYEKKVRLTWLSNSLHLEIRGRQSVKFLMGLVNYNSNNNYACIFKIRSSIDKNSINHLLSIRKNDLDPSIKDKSLIFVDDNFNYEELTFKGNSIVVNKRQALNPDGLDMKKYPFIKELVAGSNYHMWGYIYAKLNSTDFMFNRYQKPRDFLKLKNNFVVLSLNDLCDILRAKLDFSNLKDINITYINLQHNIQADAVQIKLALESKEALINDEKHSLILPPYYERSVLWMSLADACKIFNLRYYWREIDNTVLIELFQRSWY